jgi:mannose-6-phosphate isomerase-like protein (cupin superfamily)
MKPTKYSVKDTNKIDLGTKVIHKYPNPTKDFDIGKMVVNGRHPQKANTFALESACSFVMYILKGSGKVYADDNVFDVEVEDVVFMPNNCKFAG